MRIIKWEKVSKSDWISWGMLAALFGYMLALNWLMPLHRDDYWYSLIWNTSDKIRSWPDIIHSLYTHYYTHGGRMVSYFVLDSFLLLGKSWFNPFNALLYVGLMVLIYWHSQRAITGRFNPYILLLIFLFTWLGFPHFGEVNIWMAGACTYLFSAVLILVFLLPYHFAVLGRELWKDSLLTIVKMFAGGFIAGWTIENTAATMVVIVAGVTYYCYTKSRLRKWMVSGFFGSAIGFTLLVAAPGNYVRAAESNTKLIYHVTNLISAGVETLFYVLPVILFLVLVWRILFTDYALRKKVVSIFTRPGLERSFIISTAGILGVILFMLCSYLQHNFFSVWVGKLLYEHVAAGLGIATEHLKLQLFNTMSGLEEMSVYLLIILQLFRTVTYRLALRKQDIAGLSVFSRRSVMEAYPSSYHAAAWIALAIFNHVVMVASPRFPGRAAFGSVAFLIIGAVSVFTIPTVYQYLLNRARRKYLVFIVGLLMIPMMAATLYQHAVIFRENTQRMLYIEKMVNQGATQLEVEPISIKNRVMRHVYFEDLDNGVSKSLLCNYYRLKDIRLASHQ